MSKNSLKITALLATSLLVGCNESYSVKSGFIPAPTPEPEPEPEPSSPPVNPGLTIPDFVPAGALFVPNAELVVIDSSSSLLEAIHPSYSTTATNYFKFDQLDTLSVVQGKSGVAADDFVVFRADYYTRGWSTPTVELFEGNDTVVFQGYSEYRSWNSENIDLGPGDDKIVLGTASISEGKLILGTGNDKIYIAPVQNRSVVTIVQGEDKIVLTGGLTFADLVFRDLGSNISIRIKEKKSTVIENHYVTILTVSKNGGSISSLTAADFEQGEVVDAKLGLYKAGGKYPVTSGIGTPPTYLLELSGGYVSGSNFVYNDYMGDPVQFDDIQDYIFSFDSFAGRDGDMMSGHYGSTPNWKPFYFTSQQNQVNAEYYDYDYITLNMPDSGGSSYLEISPNLSLTSQSYIDLGTTDAVFVSHPYESSYVSLGSGMDSIVLNGKQQGHITYNHSIQVVLSKMASGAILDGFPGNMTFVLADTITKTDLTIVLEDGMVHIKLRDDANNLITLLRVKNATLAEVDSSLFVTGRI